MFIIFVQFLISGLILGAILYAINIFIHNFLFLGIMYLASAVIIYFLFNDYKYLVILVFASLTHLLLRKMDVLKKA